MAQDEVVICMVTTRPPKTIVKPTALGPVANTDTKLLIYGLFQKGRVLAQDGDQSGYNDANLTVPFSSILSSPVRSMSTSHSLRAIFMGPFRSCSLTTTP